MTCQWLPRAFPHRLLWSVTSWMLSVGWIQDCRRPLPRLQPSTCHWVNKRGLGPRVTQSRGTCSSVSRMSNRRSRPGEWPSETSCKEAPGLQCPLVWQRDLMNSGLAGSSSPPVPQGCPYDPGVVERFMIRVMWLLLHR